MTDRRGSPELSAAERGIAEVETGAVDPLTHLLHAYDDCAERTEAARAAHWCSTQVVRTALVAARDIEGHDPDLAAYFRRLATDASITCGLYIRKAGRTR